MNFKMSCMICNCTLINLFKNSPLIFTKWKSLLFCWTILCLLVSFFILCLLILLLCNTVICTDWFHLWKLMMLVDYLGIFFLVVISFYLKQHAYLFYSQFTFVNVELLWDNALVPWSLLSRKAMPLCEGIFIAGICVGDAAVMEWV